MREVKGRVQWNDESVGVRERRESMSWSLCDLEVQSALQRVIEGKKKTYWFFFFIIFAGTASEGT